MKRVFSISGFVLLIVAMLIMPGYPALHYYFHSDQTVIFNADPSNEANGSLASDLNYLQALMKRTSDIQNNEKSTPPSPPKPHKEINGFIYLFTNISLHLNQTVLPFHFKPYINHWQERFVPVGNPPPVC